MHQPDAIEIIPSFALDKDRWNHCIEDAAGLVYNRSWYLDAVADDWHGLVVGNYAAVMPLPVKRKWGIRLLATPAFVQQLGFCTSSSYANVRLQVAKRLESFARLMHLNLSQPDFFPHAAQRQRTNLVLDLQRPYAAIFDNYTDACKKNLRQAKTRGCVFSDELSINDVIRAYLGAYGHHGAYGANHFLKMERLVAAAIARNACILGAVRTADGELVYAGLLLDDGLRLYYLLGAPTAKGRHMRATYFFIDIMLQRFAGQRMFFDFEGSDLPDVASFYRSFAPQVEPYFEYYQNRFSLPMKAILDKKLKPF